MPDTFTGSVNGNGVAISDDGSNWVKVVGLTDADAWATSYQQIEVPLDPVMASNGLSNAGHLYIRFIGYLSTQPGSRHLIDDITVLSRSVQFDRENVAAAEGSSAVLTVTRSGSTTVAESVDYRTIAQSATAGSDFLYASGTVSFAVGDASESIVLALPDDPEEEPDETFAVRLHDPSPGLDLGAITEATVTIADNDSSETFPFRVGFESGSLGSCWTTHTEVDGVVLIDENDGSTGYPDTPVGVRSVWLDAPDSYGYAALVLHIDLSGQSNVTLSFLARRISGDDFTLPDSFTGYAHGKGVAFSTDGTTWYKLAGLTPTEFPQGYEFQRFLIDMDAQMAARGLSYGPNVQIMFSTWGNRFFDAIGVDDVRLFTPNIEFSALTAAALETDSARLTVLRQGSVSGAASVAYTTLSGSATGGVDYLTRSGTLTFADGVGSNVVEIPMRNDYLAEGPETFSVQLSNPSSGYTLGVLNPAVVTIVDDDLAAALPLEEFFSAPLGDHWVTYGNAAVAGGVLEVGGTLLNEAIVTVDAAARSNLVLRFMHRQFSSDENPMPVSFTGHGNYDGVALSIDGTNWYRVLQLEQTDQGTERIYVEREAALDPVMAAQGLAYNGHLQIKFQVFRPGGQWSKSGWFDDLVIYSREPLQMATTGLPHGTGMVAYAASLLTANGTAPFAWSVSNALPAGIHLPSNGYLAGTPTEEGPFPLHFNVTDAWGATGSLFATLVVDTNANRPPYLIDQDPLTNTCAMGEGTNAWFTLSAADPEGLPLTYAWAVDAAPASGASNGYRHATAWGDAGVYTIEARVSDGLWSNVLASWTLLVSADNDGDGMSNSWERLYGLDPWDPADAGHDGDGDHLTNLQEAGLGTSPSSADSNGDSLSDGWLQTYGFSPLEPRGLPVLSVTRGGAVTGCVDPRAVAAYGDTVYVADGPFGTKIYDASDPADPVLTNSYGSVDSVRDLAMEGSRLFLADGTNGLMKIPLGANPYALIYTRLYTYVGVSVDRVVVVSNTAYIGLMNAVQNFQILDVSEAGGSPFRGELSNSNSTRDIAVQGDFAYLAGGAGELTVVDVSDANAPVVRSALDLSVGQQGGCVAATGNVAFLGTGNWDVHVADVSNPDAPRWISTNDFTAAGTAEMQVRDGFIFLAQDGAGIYPDGGVYVFDATNSDWSVALTNFLDLDYVKDLYVTSNRMFVLDGQQGLVVYSYSGDIDRDGLPDLWERTQLGSLAYGADDDPDGDGVTNLGEWRVGLDPLDADSDGDGLQDGWEVRYLMDPRTGNLVTDSDGDGVPDVDEQVCRTDPLDAGDFLHMEGVILTGTVAIVRWAGASGTIYRVDRAYQLPGWHMAPSGAVPDAGNPRTAIVTRVEQYLDPVAGVSTSVFYRVRALDP